MTMVINMGQAVELRLEFHLRVTVGVVNCLCGVLSQCGQQFQIGALKSIGTISANGNNSIYILASHWHAQPRKAGFMSSYKYQPHAGQSDILAQIGKKQTLLMV